MQPQDYDVLVVGARAAGASTAMLLARAGARPPRRPGRTGSRHDLDPRADPRRRHPACPLGPLSTPAGSGNAAIRRTTLHYGERRVPLDIRPDGDIDGLIAPRRTILDPVIADAAREAGAEVRFRTAFRDLLRDASGRVRGAILAGPDGGPREITAGVVIGADGLRSTVARRLGAEVIRRSRHAAAHVYGYVEGLPATGTHLIFGTGISLGLMPTNGGVHCAIVSMQPSRYLACRRVATSPQGFLALAAQAAPGLDLRDLRLVERPVGFAGEHGRIHRSHGPGWALVGDASYFKDPVTSHGMTGAFRDAELLARAILEGSDAALARYQILRDAVSAELFSITDQIAAYDWSLDALNALHVRLNAALKREQAWMAQAFACEVAAA